MSSEKVRVRIAPSPTGFLHIGTARTALFNWLFVRKINGTFIVRIEDTDRERSKQEYEKDIIENLLWLGMPADEMYRQSERTAIYRQYLEKLLNTNLAFFCDHSIVELTQESADQRKAKDVARHICEHRLQNKTAGIIRFKNDSKEKLIVHDIIRGDISYQAELLGDFSLAKNLDEPLYNFAAVIDDALMHITHVIRGEDHLSNTPKQILIGRALGFTEPLWAHLPLLLGGDRSKLSKRHGALSVSEYQKAGYLPEAIINFMALLGWHQSAPDHYGKKEQEIFSKEELIQAFTLERIQKGGAIAALEKLDWFNKEHLKKIPHKLLAQYAQPFLPDTYASPQKEKILDALRMRITRLDEIPKEIESMFGEHIPSKELLSWHGKIKHDKLAEILAELLRVTSLIDASLWNKESVEEKLLPMTESAGKGTILWPLRTALSGKEVSAGPYELAGILGKEETQKRLQKALTLL